MKQGILTWLFLMNVDMLVTEEIPETHDGEGGFFVFQKVKRTSVPDIMKFVSNIISAVSSKAYYLKLCPLLTTVFFIHLKHNVNVQT